MNNEICGCVFYIADNYNKKYGRICRKYVEIYGQI